jgi:hypothetical protein
MGQMIAQLYPDQLRLAGEHATADQLAESFRELSGYQGSTLRKAITFFLNMAKYAELPLSPFFRPPAQSGATKSRTIRRPRPTSLQSSTDVAAAAGLPVPAESQTIQLESGGTVTVSCSTSFLSLSREDRIFVFDLVDRLAEYRSGKSLGKSAAVDAPNGAPSDAEHRSGLE